MLTEKDYCDYDTCVALKELGYVGSSRYYYTQRDHKFHYDAYNKFYTVRTADAMGYVLAIHLYEAQKWLREEKGYHIEIDRVGRSTGYDWQVSVVEMEHNLCESAEHNNETYEEALSEGIEEAIRFCMKQNIVTMETKFNSQVCTTREQSERLLALGLKKETADMCLPAAIAGRGLIEYYGPIALTERVNASEWDILTWSLHRLLSMLNEDDGIIIEITAKDGRYGIHSGYDTEWHDDLYDGIIEVFDTLIKEGSFNKEYLI